MRGEQENRCLQTIRDGIFSSNGKLLQNPFTGKTYKEVSVEEFLVEKIWFTNSDCRKCFFGLMEEDRIEIEKILFLAKPNENASEFPDFIFDNGFIEHFQITSSKVTRKGATHKKEESAFDAKVAKETEALEKEWNEPPSYLEAKSKSWTFTNPEHSYEYLEESFRTVWKYHIGSLNKYCGNKDVVIFMIVYTVFALAMTEQVYAKWKDGMSSGDMREEEKFKFYRLSRDKKLLNFISQYKDKIKYVIFAYCNGFEIIRLENIPYLLNLMPWDYYIYPLVAWKVASVGNISVPEILPKEE